MQDILDSINRYAVSIGGGPTYSSKPTPLLASQQFLGSLLLRNSINSFCLRSVAEFMDSDEVLAVVSRDAIQTIQCYGYAFQASNSILNPCPGELSGITAAGNNVLVCSSNGVNRITRSLETNKDPVFCGYVQNILCITATPDGAYCATGGGNATVTVWSQTMQEMHHLTGHTDWVHFVKFSKPADELYLFSTGDDGVICQWDPLEGVQLSRLDYTRGQSIQVFEVSFRTNLIAISNGSVLVLYNYLSGHHTKQMGDDVLRLLQLSLLSGVHQSPPTTARFSENAEWLASAAEDETLAVCTVREPRQIFTCTAFVTRRHCMPFMNTFSSIAVLACPPASSVVVIAACASDGSVIQWVVDPRDRRSTYTKRIQLHLGALLSMDWIKGTKSGEGRQLYN